MKTSLSSKQYLLKPARAIVTAFLLMLTLQSLSAQQITGDDYLRYETIYNKLIKLIGNLGGVEEKTNREDSFQMFKDGKSATVYNDIQKRGTSLEDYLNDLSKKDKRIYNYQGVYFVHPPVKGQHIVVYLDLEIYNNKGEIIGGDIYKSELRLDKNKFTIYSFLVERIRNKVDLSTFLKYTPEFSSAAEQAIEMELDSRYGDFDEQKIQTKGAEFYAEFISNHKTMAEESFLVKKSAKKKLQKIISNQGEFEDYQTKKVFQTNTEFIAAIDKRNISFTGRPSVQVENFNSRKNSKKIDLIVKVKQTAKINNRPIQRETRITYKKLKGNGKARRLVITSIHTGQALTAVEERQAADSINSFISSYITCHGRLPGDPELAEDMTGRFFYAPTSPVFPDQEPGKKMLGSRDYLMSVAGMNPKSKMTYRINSTGAVLQSDQEEGLFYKGVKLEMDHEIPTDTSVITIKGLVNVVVQFKKDGADAPKGFKIETISPYRDVRIKEIKPVQPEPTIEPDLSKNDVEEFLVRSAFTNQGIQKAKLFLHAINKHSSKDKLSKQEIGKIKDLFIEGGMQSEIGVSNYKKPKKNNFSFYSISEYFDRLGSLKYKEMRLNPVIISDSFSIQDQQGENSEWIGTIRFKQEFDGFQGRHSYCDETIKEITIIIRKEGKTYNAYLGNVTPLKDGTKKRDCDEIKKGSRA